jgi:hypothetical protein
LDLRWNFSRTQATLKFEPYNHVKRNRITGHLFVDSWPFAYTERMRRSLLLTSGLCLLSGSCRRGGMGGGMGGMMGAMWIWWTIGILLIVLLVVIIIRLLR